MAELSVSGRDVRGLLRREGFKVESASSNQAVYDLAAMRSFDGIVFAAAHAKRVLECLEALCPLLMQIVPVLCIGDFPSGDEIALYEAGLTLCLPSQTPPAIVLAQLRALLSVAECFPPHDRLGPLGIDFLARRASLDGQPLCLRPKEFDMLGIFIAHRDEILTAEWLHSALWPHRSFRANRVATHVHLLRHAITSSTHHLMLQTARGKGYVLSTRLAPCAV